MKPHLRVKKRAAAASDPGLTGEDLGDRFSDHTSTGFADHQQALPPRAQVISRLELILRNSFKSRRLPWPQRIVVAGAAGAGKTTLCHALSHATGINHIELDALYFGRNWSKRPDFEKSLEHLLAQSNWITEWQYDEARAVLLGNCDLFIWLDLPRWRVTIQAIVRSARRRIKRTPLWNSNKEPPLLSILWNSRHTVRWGWNNYQALSYYANEARGTGKPFVRVCSRRDATLVVSTLESYITERRKNMNDGITIESETASDFEFAGTCSFKADELELGS